MAKLEGISRCEPEREEQRRLLWSLQSLLHVQVLTVLYFGEEKEEMMELYATKHTVERDAIRSEVYLVTGRLFLSVDPEENGFLCVVTLHLDYDVIFVRLVLSATKERGCSEAHFCFISLPIRRFAYCKLENKKL